MKKQNLALTILLALGITACSHSGGDSSSPKADKPTAQTKPAVVNPVKPTKPEAVKPVEPKKPETVKPTEPTKPETVKPAEPTKPELVKPTETAKPEVVKPKIEEIPVGDNFFSKKTSYTSYVFSRPRTAGGQTILIATAAHADNNNFIDVDNHIIEIFPEGFNSNNLFLKSGNSIKQAQRNKNTLLSIVNDYAYNDIYMIVNGINPTKNMDSLSGIIKYTGTGYHAYPGVENGKNVTIYDDSKVEMTADFNNKTVLGKITSPKESFDTVEFGANITDNSFQGKLNGVETKGGFFGENAAEAVGSYYNDSSLYGVFGVKK